MKRLNSFKLVFLILLQRTDIQRKITNRIFLKINHLFHGALSTLFILMQSLNYKKVLNKYKGAIVEESNLINDLIFSSNSGSIHTVLDIGCGLGGYHLKWLKNSKGRKIELFLMDASHFNLTALNYGHGEPKRYYNSLKLAKNLLIGETGVDSKLIHLVEVEHDFPRRLPQNIDLVVSFISWGFHYSLEQYWGEIISRLTVDKSIMVIDVRKNSPSSNFLSLQNNITTNVLSSSEKLDRIMIRKRAAT